MRSSPPHSFTRSKVLFTLAIVQIVTIQLLLATYVSAFVIHALQPSQAATLRASRNTEPSASHATPGKTVGVLSSLVVQYR